MTAILGLIAGITALITAIAGLYVLLSNLGIIRPSEPKQKLKKQKPKESEKTFDHDYPAEDKE